jgi:hypothetical protein
MRASLTEFRGLPHRTQLVAEGGGVRWVDDSKGTNVDAAAKSLEGFAPQTVLLILGGRDKHGDFQALRPLVQRAARRVLTIGEAADAIETALAGAAPIERCETMQRPSRGRRLSRGPATPCCCRPRARRSTSIGTTRNAETTSPDWRAKRQAARTETWPRSSRPTRSSSPRSSRCRSSAA